MDGLESNEYPLCCVSTRTHQSPTFQCRVFDTDLSLWIGQVHEEARNLVSSLPLPVGLTMHGSDKVDVMGCIVLETNYSSRHYCSRTVEPLSRYLPPRMQYAFLNPHISVLHQAPCPCLRACIVISSKGN